jgi:hypothetical protein
VVERGRELLAGDGDWLDEDAERRLFALALVDEKKVTGAGRIGSFYAYDEAGLVRQVAVVEASGAGTIHFHDMRD